MSKNRTTDRGRLLELSIRILTDRVDRRRIACLLCDAIYLVGETKSNEDSVLFTCCEVWALGGFLKICLAESQFSPGKRYYPNFAVDWKRELIRRNNLLRESDFSIFRFPKGPIEHTGTEMLGLISHAKQQNWKDVLLIAAPFHQLRTFLSAVAAIKKFNYPLRVWNYSGEPLSWNEESVHSQGVQKGTRVDFIHAELKKIYEYSARGDIATIDEGLEYLNQRNINTY